MRFITLLGLTVIAKCIDPVRVVDWAVILVIIMVVGLLADIYELYLKSTK